MRSDLVSGISAALSIAPQARTAAVNGTGVDLANYDAAAVVITSGTITDGTGYTFEVQQSDDNTTFTTVAAAELAGAVPTLVATDDNVVREIGYKGIRRYLRVAITTVTGAPTTGGLFAAYVVRGKARTQPV